VRAILLGALVLLIAEIEGANTRDLVIVPGVRIGPVTKSSTRQDVSKAFGDKWVVDSGIDVGEGEIDPGTVVHKEDPSRALAILWEGPNDPAHPRMIFVCYGRGISQSPPCRWRTTRAIGINSTLRQLEAINGRPFALVVTGGAYFVRSWQSGKLADHDRLWIHLCANGSPSPKLTREEDEAVRT